MFRKCSPRQFYAGIVAAGTVALGSGSNGNSDRSAVLCSSPSSRVTRDSTLGTTDHKSNSIITRNDQYCEGIQIYGIGIKEDPVPGGRIINC